MMAPIQITPWHWAGFILCVLIFLALDLGVFHRGRRTSSNSRRRSAGHALWFALAMLFAVALAYADGHEEAVEFVTGYFIELSLSHGQRLRHRDDLSVFSRPGRNPASRALLGHLGGAADARR